VIFVKILFLLWGVTLYFPKYGKFSQALNFWWQRLNLMKFTYLESAWESDSFDVSFSIKVPFFRVLFTIEPGCSLLQFVTTNCLISVSETRYWICSIWKAVTEFSIDRNENDLPISSMHILMPLNATAPKYLGALGCQPERSFDKRLEWYSLVL